MLRFGLVTVNPRRQGRNGALRRLRAPALNAINALSHIDSATNLRVAILAVGMEMGSTIRLI